LLRHRREVLAREHLRPLVDAVAVGRERDARFVVDRGEALDARGDGRGTRRRRRLRILQLFGRKLGGRLRRSPGNVRDDQPDALSHQVLQLAHRFRGRRVQPLIATASRYVKAKRAGYRPLYRDPTTRNPLLFRSLPAAGVRWPVAASANPASRALRVGRLPATLDAPRGPGAAERSSSCLSPGSCASRSSPWRPPDCSSRPRRPLPRTAAETSRPWTGT